MSSLVIQHEVNEIIKSSKLNPSKMMYCSILKILKMRYRELDVDKVSKIVKYTLKD